MLWTVGAIPEEFTYGRVGYLSTRAKVRLMLHDRHIGSRVADQRPGIAVTAFVQNTLSHVELIGLAVLGSSAMVSAACMACASESWEPQRQIHGTSPTSRRFQSRSAC